MCTATFLLASQVSGRHAPQAIAWSRTIYHKDAPRSCRPLLCLAEERPALLSSTEPEIMRLITSALYLDSYAPQLQPRGSAVLPQRIAPLRAEEIEALEQLPEAQNAVEFSDNDHSLLQRSLESLDYLGDWADPAVARDSIVLCCASPEVRECESGPEFTCRYDAFTRERHLLHAHIIERMLTLWERMPTWRGGPGLVGYGSSGSSSSSRSADAIAEPSTAAGDDQPAADSEEEEEGKEYEEAAEALTTAAVAAASAAAAAAADSPEVSNGSPPPLLQPPLLQSGGPPALRPPAPGEQHVYIVVGVPGSGKDTVLKRYLSSLGLPLLDASADLIKEYLAAWGQDELSVLVRRNNERAGPGKHLLHSQYLHRESIALVDQLVERALALRRTVLLEKTLFNLEPVLASVRQCRAAGCRVHLLGTHIQPLRNWAFLEARMASGESFGRYITREQAIGGLRRYQLNLERILEEPELRASFDSIHVYDVMAGDWCVSLETSPTERTPR